MLHPANQSVNVGQDAGFTVAAEGAGPLTYQWYKDNSAIDGQTGASLSIVDAQASDAGLYRCDVSSPWGTAPSNGATLSVSDPAQANSADFVDTTLPPQIPAGGSRFVGVTMKNTSPLTWSGAQGYGMAVTSDSDGILQPNPGGRLPIHDPLTVVPANGGVYQFIAEIVAPAAPGTYTATIRMIEENVEFFGPTVQIVFESIPPPNAAADWEAYE